MASIKQIVSSFAIIKSLSHLPHYQQLMASAAQISSLIQSHFEHDHERFVTLALQIAAHEARLGHGSVALQIRDIVDREKTNKLKARIIKLQPDLSELLVQIEPKSKLNQLVLPDELNNRIERIIHEFKQKKILQQHGLSHRRKILLVGPPGTGKTMTAAVLAGELGLPYYSVLMHGIVTKFLGETGGKLRQVFDFIDSQTGVFFFDEFDALGADRSKENEVGEMRRALNSFLQFIESSNSDSLIIAATNNIGLLDNALFRRFDDILQYRLPSKTEAIKLVKNRLGLFGKGLKPTDFDKSIENLSHAQLGQACDDAIKTAILSGNSVVNPATLTTCFEEKKGFHP